MINELVQGQFSPTELQLRNKLRLYWAARMDMLAEPIVNSLLHDNKNDGLLWALWFMLDSAICGDEADSVTTALKIVDSELPLDEQLRALRFMLETPHAPSLVIFTTVLLSRLYQRSSIPEELIPVCLSISDAMISEGMLSFARDFLEFVVEITPDHAGETLLASLPALSEDFQENPVLEFSALFLQLLLHLDLVVNEDTRPTFKEFWLPASMAAFLDMKDNLETDYLVMQRDARRLYIEAMADIMQGYIENPSTCDASELLLGLAQRGDIWKVKWFGRSLAEQMSLEEEDEEEIDESFQLPEFDDEDYLRCVDFFVDNFESFLPGRRPENKAFAPLLLLPVYASGYRITDLRQCLTVSGSLEFEFIRIYITDMHDIVEVLWDMTGAHDDVDKALFAIDAYSMLLVHIDEIEAKDTIEAIFSTLKAEKKTIQKIMKEFRHSDR